MFHRLLQVYLKQIWHPHGYVRVVHHSLSLFFKRTYVTTSYVTNHEIQTITVTLADNNKSQGVLGRIFNLPAGTLTLTQTSPNSTTSNAGFLAAVNASSNVAPLALNLGGINYIKVFCDMSKGFKAAYISLPGCLDTTLLVLYQFPVYLGVGSTMCHLQHTNV